MKKFIWAALFLLALQYSQEKFYEKVVKRREKMKSLGVRVSDEFYERVKEYAWRKRVPVARVIIVALEKELKPEANV